MADPVSTVHDDDDFVGLMTVPSGMTLEEVNAFNAEFRLPSKDERAIAMRSLIDGLRALKVPVIAVPTTKVEPISPQPQ